MNIYIKELKAALKVRMSKYKCPLCKEILSNGQKHSESCKHFTIESKI